MKTTEIKMALMTLLPAVVSLSFYLLAKYTAFGKLKNAWKQVIYGLAFGGLAILGTEFGVPVSGATLNVRDAAPLCAGLFFGAPAGVIAGIIGGTERWFAALWGAGYYTRVACTIGTIFAGLFGAWLRRWLFDDKKPSWFYALAIGLVTEVLHMLLIYVTNMDDVANAYKVVQVCYVPMIACVGLAVMLAALVLAVASGEPLFHGKRKQRKIAQTFQRGLLVCVVIAYVVTNLFTALLQASLSQSTVRDLMRLYIQDVRSDIEDAVDNDLLGITQSIAEEVDADPTFANTTLTRLKNQYNVSVISIVDKNGVITQSTTDSYVGYDMNSGTQSAAFLVLNSGETELVQAYGPMASDPSVNMKYAGVALAGGGFVQVGYDAERFQQNVDIQVVGITRNRHVGENGYIILVDANLKIVSDRNHHEGQSMADSGLISRATQPPADEMFYNEVYGVECYCMYTESEGYYIVAVMPVEETLFNSSVSVDITSYMEVLILAAMFIMIYLLIKKLVVDNIHQINGSLAKITDGNLDVVVNVRTNQEFASLSDDINSTVVRLKQYISEAAARIDKELEFAKTIQESSLPLPLPYQPETDDFEIFASMTPAKEVGGDFYDFYFLPGNRLAFLVADVSGKGISAAMFMMKAKTLLKGLAQTENDAAAAMTKANDELCRNNEAEMFVTCWMGILALDTGLVTFANAGHNPPLVRRKNGAVEFLRSRPGFVLGGMEGIRYRTQQTLLLPGDEIFLYTDGVTEATNAANELFGNDRLLDTFEKLHVQSARKICTAIKAKVDAFVGAAPQFDDMTMVSLRIADRNTFHAPPSPQLLPQIQDQMEQMLEGAGVSRRVLAKMQIAMDEIYTNVCSYSGAANAAVHCDVRSGHVTLVVADDGKPYDPLMAKEPDVTLPAAQRQIGGLGIHIVKKSMDLVEYHADRGWNILIMQKVMPTVQERTGDAAAPDAPTKSESPPAT